MAFHSEGISCYNCQQQQWISSTLQKGWHWTAIYSGAPEFLHHAQQFSHNSHYKQCVSLVDKNNTNLSAYVCNTFKSVLWKITQQRYPKTGRPGQHHTCSDDIQSNLQDRKPGVYPELSSWTFQLFRSYSHFWWTAVSWSLSGLCLKYGSAYFIATYKFLYMNILEV